MARDAGLLRQVERFLPFVAGAVLVAGILVFALNRGGARPLKEVPVDPRAVATARAFIRDAVQRKDLEAAYRLVTPELRRGYSLARWQTGNIPIVPFPGDRLVVAPFAPKLSLTRRVVLSTELRSSAAPITPFRIELVKRGGRWRVSSWVPGRAQSPER